MNIFKTIVRHTFRRSLSLFDLVWLLILSALGGWYWLLWIPLVVISAIMQVRVENEPNS